MATQVTEPRINEADLTDWQKFILRTTEQLGGFALIGLTNMDNDLAPDVMAGTRFEINGALYKCAENDGDESITGECTNNAVNYIYAQPYGTAGQCRFVYSAEAPTLQPLKGGLYKENDRCIGNLFYQDGKYLNKNINTNMEIRMMGSQNILKNEIVPSPIGSLLHTMATPYRSLRGRALR